MIEVLDHGYVRFVESWGHGDAGVGNESFPSDDECGIVEAARQSTQGSFRGWEKDQRLLAYLFNARPQHASPFEFAGMVVEVQAPIFVFREWQRHRTQSYAEMSARYEPLPDTNYVPTVERLLMNERGGGKQSDVVRDAGRLDKDGANQFRKLLTVKYEQDELLYQSALKCGVPKELARIILPVGRYSRMRASANLRNWLAFLTLRADPAAQWETQEYALAVEELIRDRFPKTWKLFRADK